MNLGKYIDYLKRNSIRRYLIRHKRANIEKKGVNIMKPFYFACSNKNLKIGDHFTLFPNSRFDICYNRDNAKITIGNHVWISYNFTCLCADSVTIEDYVMFGPNCFVIDFHHGIENCNTPFKLQANTSKPISVGYSSWVGADTKILAGVHIGKYCVIGAGAVVTKDIPDYSIAVGNPAKVIKRFNHEKKVWERV